MTTSATRDERVNSAPRRGELARSLLDSLVAHPAGQVSASVYETARLVALAPSLDGHDARLRFLQTRQQESGGWGRDDGYGLVPTLSATDALLTLVRRGDAPAWVRHAAHRGLGALRRWLAGPAPIALPDTPGIEVLVPALLQSLNATLAAEDGPNQPLPMPDGADLDTLAGLRAAAERGGDLPTKFLHSLEALAPLPSAARTLQPQPEWTVGASPAATAAWLGVCGSVAGSAAHNNLRDLVRRYGGPVPSVIPITAFERAWVLTTLVDTELDVGGAVVGRLIRELAAGIGEQGTAGGAGLPPDADTTSVALLALEQVGLEPDLDCLLGYEVPTHFQTWTGERTPSVTTNAHVLDVFALRLVRVPGQSARYGQARDRVIAWLRDQQSAEGSWSDKWHASPFYATAACVVALRRSGEVAAEPAVQRMVARATRWLLASQREDGGWGRWCSTAEETAYAVRALHTGGRVRPAVRAALGRAKTYLAAAVDDAALVGTASDGTALDGTVVSDDDPAKVSAAALWHDKELYRPEAVVRATVLAARHLLERRVAQSRPGVATH